MMEAAGEGVTVIFLAMLGVLFVFWYGANLGGSKTHKNLECANSYHENPPNRILNRVFELNSVENKMQLKSDSKVTDSEVSKKIISIQ